MVKRKWKFLGVEAGCSTSAMHRYALQLVDTIKVDSAKSVSLTEPMRSTKDTLFFLNTEDGEEEEPKKKAHVNGAPPKQKTIGGKVLRNQTRRTAQDEVHLTAVAKLADHQRELHDKLQAEGLQKYSEDGVGVSGKEGKGWKKFQSYKGDAALPAEVEKLRVRTITHYSITGANIVLDIC
jgi:nucleosome binding factor SPN SPT16 subunit